MDKQQSWRSLPRYRRSEIIGDLICWTDLGIILVVVEVVFAFIVVAAGAMGLALVGVGLWVVLHAVALWLVYR